MRMTITKSEIQENTQSKINKQTSNYPFTIW